MTPADRTARAQAIAAVIERARIPTNTEEAAHGAIEAALAAAGIATTREAVLDERSRLDLLVDGAIAIEVKAKGAKRAIWRQVQRYAEHPRVAAVVLATSVAFPFRIERIGDKPIVVASLARGWL